MTRPAHQETRQSTEQRSLFPTFHVSRLNPSSGHRRGGGPDGLAQRSGRGNDGAALVAGMSHAVGAPAVSPVPVGLPVGLVDQLAVGGYIPVGHQVAGSLPAHERVAGDGPGTAGEVGLAFQEVQEDERSLSTPPMESISLSDTSRVRVQPLQSETRNGSPGPARTLRRNSAPVSFGAIASSRAR